ncbi:MAG: DUF72 domain-containing protein [Sulfolobales archaeon]
MKILIGTCGFPRRRDEIFKNLDVVEHQEIFYDLISSEKAERYGREKPENFIYTAKAFQAITHSPNSPTWKKIKTKLIGDLSKYGFMRPTEENLWAWNESLKIYKLMKVKIVVFQTPPSFGYSEENYRVVRDFFSIINRDDLMLAWEPRGSWNQGNNKNKLCRLLEESKIIHAVDIFRNTPCEETGDILYIRLHGIGGSEVNYRYKYTDDDLKRLKEIIMRYNYREVYVLFNNVYMFDDAVRFRSLLKSQ